MRLPLGRCYNISVAESRACREARDGACVRYAEGMRLKRAGAGEVENPRTACTADSSGSSGSCKVCGVRVSESEYCSECISPDTHAPVNGQCTRCGGNSLLYMGGCYEASEGKPGYNLCTLASNGVCTEAAPGYFLNPLKANDKDSVVSCSDTTSSIYSTTPLWNGHQ